MDPARQFASPYVGMGNNPVSGIDPDGRDCPSCPNDQRFDAYRNNNAMFGYDPDIGVYSDMGVGVTGTRVLMHLDNQNGGSDPDSPSVYDQNLSEFNWLNLAAAEVTIWGGATSIAVSGPKPTYTGSGDWARQVKAGTKFGRGLGVLGLAITGTDMLVNGVNTSNSLDATMGVVAFFGPIGAGVSGAYFVGNLITVGITGQSIGEHIDNYYWVPNPGGIGFIPVGKKLGR